jgi:hypothetical protein
VLHLTKLGVFPEGITSGDYQQLHEQRTSSERSINALEAFDRPVLGKDEQDDNSNMELVPVRAATILPQSKEVQDGVYVSTVSAEFSVGAVVMMVGQ